MVLPNEEEAKQVEALETPSEPAEPPINVPRQAPQKRKRSLFGAFFSTLLLLILIAGAGLYAAIAFKDKDERLRLVADYAEPYVADASGAFERLKGNIDSLLGETKPPPQTKVTTHRTAPAEATEPAAPALEPPPQRAEPAPEPEAPPAAAPPQRAEVAPEPEPPAPAMPAAETPKAGSALESRIEALEESAQKALRAAEAAQAAAESAAKASQAVKPADHGALTAGDQLAALEGRIDELGEEIKALRERLDSPKSETRAAPEALAAKAPDFSAALVVAAYALQRELDAGRPYADEVAALTRLGADPAQIAILSPLSEKGAPTAAQLKAEFAPAAKRIRALEGAHGTGDFTEHLMQGASKLVRVRPSGQAPAAAQTVEEKVAKIEAALTHGDVYAAGAAFSTLPEAAQGEAKEFGEALRARVDAGRAADGLLHGAIAALGGAKK